MQVAELITEARCWCDHSREAHQLKGNCISCYLEARKENRSPLEARHPFQPTIRVRDAALSA